jgi:C4-type Zn-finger protein
MKPLPDARMEDLDSQDLVIIECGKCSHRAYLLPIRLYNIGIKPYVRIVDLHARVRCTRCGYRDKDRTWKNRLTNVNILWGAGRR